MKASLNKFMMISLALAALAFSAESKAQEVCSRVFLSESRSSAKALTSVLEKSLRLNQAMTLRLQGSVRARHHFESNGLREKVVRTLQFLYNVPVQALNPVPIRLNKLLTWDAPANSIFEKMWRNPRYEPTDAEKVVLRKYGVESQFNERRQFLLDNKKWYRVRKAISDSYRSGLWVAFFLQTYFAVHSSENYLGLEEYLREGSENSEDLSVEILSETTPFPHVAIRVGGRVYSYGYESLSVSTLRQYLSAGRDSSGPLSRVVQIVKINASKDQALRLKESLESKKANDYINITLVNDCASMISRALSSSGIVDIPEAVDASPAALIQYLSLLKIKGDPRIGRLSQVQIGGSELSREPYILRNFYINSMETKLWLVSLPQNYLVRLGLEIGLFGDEVEYRSVEVQNAISEYRRVIAKSVASSFEIQGLSLYIERLKNKSDVTAADIAALRRDSDTLLTEMKLQAQKTIATLGVDLLEREQAEERLLVLQQIEIGIREEIEELYKKIN